MINTDIEIQTKVVYADINLNFDFTLSNHPPKHLMHLTLKSVVWIEIFIFSKVKTDELYWALLSLAQLSPSMFLIYC